MKNEGNESLSWRAALLGASVGIAGPAYFGTLLSSVTLWIFLGQGGSVQEAYTYLFRFDLTFAMMANLTADIFFSVMCGWVSAAHGRGVPMAQGVVSGLLSTSFIVVMALNPANGAMPPIFRIIALAIPVLGSMAGAYAYMRRMRTRPAKL